jgi:methylenetetrahydrofolate reductase (NADPH)
MSKKLHLLSDCVGYTIPEDTPYDPMANLKELQSIYSGFGMYLAMLGMKTQFPLLKGYWT